MASPHWVSAVLLALVARSAVTMEVKMDMPLHYDRDRTGKTPSFRRNFCHLEEKLRNGTLELRDALRGEMISVIIEPGGTSSWSYEFEEPADGSPPLPVDQRTYIGGYQLELLDELAKRAGFDWKTNFAASAALMPGETWTQYADYWLDRYDLAVNWYVETSERKRQHMVFPFNWLDASVMIFAKVNTDEPELIDKFFSFLNPFSTELWYVVLGTCALSALVYWLIERSNEDEFGHDTAAKGISHALYLAAGELTGTQNLSPKSWAGKLFSISWAFVVLLTISAYTANLASYLVVLKSESVEIKDIEEAVEKKAPLCCLTGAAICSQVLSVYPGAIMHYVKDWGSMFEEVRRGSCKAGISTVAIWDLQSVGDLNKQCDMRWVGRAVKSGSAGWLSRADHKQHLCTQVMTETIGLHMLEMEEEGVIAEMWERRLSKENDKSSNTCTAQAAPQAKKTGGVRLTAENMAGLFLIHAILSTICLIMNFGPKLLWRGRRRLSERFDHHEDVPLPPPPVNFDERQSELSQVSTMDGMSGQLHKVCEAVSAMQQEMVSMRQDVYFLKKAVSKSRSDNQDVVVGCL